MLGFPVKSCGQKDLADNGYRSWDDNIRGNLDSNYPDWKNPIRTHMVPPVFQQKSSNPDAGESTEKEIFNLLQKFGEKRSEPMFVVHSYNFNEHISEQEHGTLKSKWVMGEHDFVLLHRSCGLVFFQVKAAVKKLPKFKEAESQLYKDKLSLKIFAEKNLKSKLKRGITDAFISTPGFVVMPNCPQPDSHHGPSHGLFKENCETVENFSKWWDEFIAFERQDAIDEQVFQELVMRFVGFVHISPCLSSCIEASHRVLMFETKEQLKLRMDSVPEQWVTGPAGSGKTCLLITKVQMLAEGILDEETLEKILILCYNRPLSSMLRKTFEASLENRLKGKDLTDILHIKTFHKLLVEITGHHVHNKENAVREALEIVERSIPTNLKYDHVFVDEGQDLPGEWPQLLKKLMSISNGEHQDEIEDLDHPNYFWVMYDANQHLDLFQSRTHLHSSSLKKSARLSNVLRNTENIYKQSRKYFKPLLMPCRPFDIGHREVGLPIKWDHPSTSESMEGCLVKNIRHLQHQGVEPRDICVLVSDEKKRYELMMCLENIHGIKCQNAEENIEHAENKLVVESIRRFKGLESKVVVLFNPRFETFKDYSTDKTLLYTAMSRCLCYLVVISCPWGCMALQSEKGVDMGISVSQPQIRDKKFRYMPTSNADNFAGTSSSENTDEARVWRKQTCSRKTEDVGFFQLKKVAGNSCMFDSLDAMDSRESVPFPVPQASHVVVNKEDSSASNGDMEDCADQRIKSLSLDDRSDESVFIKSAIKTAKTLKEKEGKHGTAKYVHQERVLATLQANLGKAEIGVSTAGTAHALNDDTISRAGEISKHAQPQWRTADSVTHGDGADEKEKKRWEIAREMPHTARGDCDTGMIQPKGLPHVD